MLFEKYILAENDKVQNLLQIKGFNIFICSGITISIPGAESQDSERRRQIALRALSERLSKVRSKKKTTVVRIFE